MRSIARIKRLAKEWDAEVIFTHDMDAFKSYALAPEPFVGSRALSTAGGQRMKLDGRVAIVTGAAQGIGRAIADKLHAEGAEIAVVDINGEGAAAAASRLDGLAITADISSEADAERMAGETLDRYGKIDVLVNAAAIVPFIPWDEVDFAYWRKLSRSTSTAPTSSHGRSRARCARRATAESCRSPPTRFSRARRTWARTSPPRAASSG